MNQILGIILILLPFLALFSLVLKIEGAGHGIKIIIATLILTGFTMACVIGGIYLLKL